MCHLHSSDPPASYLAFVDNKLYRTIVTFLLKFSPARIRFRPGRQVCSTIESLWNACLVSSVPRNQPCQGLGPLPSRIPTSSHEPAHIDWRLPRFLGNVSSCNRTRWTHSGQFNMPVATHYGTQRRPPDASAIPEEASGDLATPLDYTSVGYRAAWVAS
ncbi:hypothetical protein BU23DRAFT_177849 [Bimuria novae-zelandiae CBS 107.79]|uniref:Uncharacterized protein n=1 Tax=Bimuria novae-zelandiae CBS 107.79 TaxID=1447943 RepID=A0A6A5V2Z7_9PLEO|nr:hypothetical protein BU23DRAFT_177849 [Bimuria novae-zelandiae CBS 107.79]